MRLAVKQNPAYRSALERVSAARGEYQQARSIRFNPDLSFAGGPDPQVALLQEVEWAGQRGVRASAVGFGLARVGSYTADVGRHALTDVGIGYARVIAASGKRRVVEQLLALTERLIQAVRIQLREGEISLLDANLAEIEHGRSRARTLAARRDVLGAELELKRLLGIPPATALRLAEDAAPLTIDGGAADSLIALGLRQRPDLEAARAEVAESQRLATLARREALPNLRIGGVADPTGSRGTGLAIGITLPVLNRNRGTIAARDADARRAAFDRAALEAQVRVDVTFALLAFQSAAGESSVFAETVLGPARANATLLEEAYRAGKLTLTSLLLLRNQLLDAEFGHWDAWLMRQESFVRLEAATGALTPPTSTSDAGPSASNRP